MTALRLRIRSRQHPHGYRVYSYEVRDPTRPEGHQALTLVGTFLSWDAARRHGYKTLRDYQPPILSPADLPKEA